MMLTLPFCYTIIYLTNVLCLAIQVISNFLLLQLETWIFLWGIHTEEPLWREKRWWGDESHTRTHTTAYREWRKSKVTQSCLTLCNPMDCSPPGSSVHGILLARILEWVAISFSRGSSRARDGTHISCVSCMGRGILFQSSCNQLKLWSFGDTPRSPQNLNSMIKLLIVLIYLTT